MSMVLAVPLYQHPSSSSRPQEKKRIKKLFNGKACGCFCQSKFIFSLRKLSFDSNSILGEHFADFQRFFLLIFDECIGDCYSVLSLPSFGSLYHYPNNSNNKNGTSGLSNVLLLLESNLC